MDVVLGVSVADQVARLALLEASPLADGGVLDQYEVALTDATASVAELADTILATKRSLNGDGHRLVSIRVCAPTLDRAERVRNALCAAGFGDGDVTVVTQTEVIDVLRATNPLPTAAADATAFAVARGAALTATTLPPLDALDVALASSPGPQLAYSQAAPDSGSLDRLLADPPTATNDIPLQTAMAPLQDFTPWAAAEEDVPVVAPAGAGRRTRLLLVGSGVTGIAAVAVAVLAVSVAVRVQPTASAQNDIGGPVTSFMPKPHAVDEAVAVPTPAPPGPVIVAAADDPFGPGYSPLAGAGNDGGSGAGGPVVGADPVAPVGQSDGGGANQPPQPDSGAPAVDVGAFTGPLQQFGQGLAGVLLGNLIAQGKISTTPTTSTATTTTSARSTAELSTTSSTPTPTTSTSLVEPIYTDGSVTSSSDPGLSTTSTTTSVSSSAPEPASALATPSSTTTTTTTTTTPTTTPTTTTTTTPTTTTTTEYPTTSSPRSQYVAPPPPPTASETRETPQAVITEPAVTHAPESKVEPAPQPISTPETTEHVEVPSSTQESSSSRSSSSTPSTTVSSTNSSSHA